MDLSLTEPVTQTNGKVPVPEVPHSIANHQPYPSPSSSPVNAHCGMDRRKPCSQAETGDDNLEGCIAPNGCPSHPSQALPSCGAPCGYKDFDPTKSPPQINTILQNTSSHVSRTVFDHDKIPVSPGPTEPVSSASSGLGLPEPTQRSPPSANSQPAEDDPLYDVGQIKIFDQKQKPVPKLHESRWQVIRPDIFDRVETRLRRGRFAMRLNKPRAPTVIDLMSAGADKERSVPAVVVVVPKHIKTMQNFLNTDSTVQSRCRPEDGTTVELLVLACRGSSTLIGMPSEALQHGADSPSDSEDTGELSDDDSSLGSSDDTDSSGGLHPTTGMLEADTRSMSVVCEGSSTERCGKYGMSIRLITKDGSRFVRGTCGGLLQLLGPHNQPPRQVGLIAGHLLEQLGQGSEESDQGTVEIPRNTGDILYPKMCTEIPRHDWALFDAGKLNLEYDKADQRGIISTARGSEIPAASTLVVIRTTRGEMSGTLSPSTSGIMLRPNQGFVHVRTIVMDRGSTVTQGDSGAWVYHREFGNIYGYIIAADRSRHTYMVPLQAAITEMRLALGAVSISLALPVDRSLQRRLSSETHGHSQQARGSQQDPEPDSEPDFSAIRNEVRRLKEIAGKFLDDGKAENAILWLKTGVSIQERLPQEDQSRLAWQHKLGKAYLEVGLVPEAISILKNIVEVRQEVLEGSHADSLAAQHELAVAYIQNGQAPEAIALLKHVVATEAEILDQSHIGRLTSQHELGRAYLAGGNALEAIKALEHVVAVKKEALEEQDPHLLASQIVLAEASLRAGRAPYAVKILEHVIAVATGASSEHKKMRIMSREWLSLAQRHQTDMNPQRPAAQDWKPLSIFLGPRK